VGALVGLDVRRNLRYFTPVFSVAFESFGIFRVTWPLRHGPFGARAAPVRYRAVRAVIGLDVRRNLRYFTPVFSVAFEGHGVWGGQLENLKIRKMPKLLSLERDWEYGREVAQMAPHMQADHSAHRAVSHRVSARSKQAMETSGPGE
jgi:hypothetical protein